MMNRTLIAALVSLTCVGAIAQGTGKPDTGAPATRITAATVTERNVRQQTRIDDGLKSGALSTREAAGLERQQAKVDRLEAHDLKDGHLSAQERVRLQAAQDKASRNIAVAKHNAVTGDPTSRASRRMQADVGRDVHQQGRIAAGVRDGSLTHHEAASLERGQAATERREAVAGANGHVSASEQAVVQRSENHQSRRIHRERANGAVRS